MAQTRLAPLENYKSKSPPAFGHPMLEYFLFDKNFTNMNHGEDSALKDRYLPGAYHSLMAGSYGSTPIPVLDASKAFADQVEANPEVFHRLDYIPLLVAARERVAKVIGVRDVDELVFVPNASHGLNTVLWNLIWEEGDIIIACNTTYNSIGRTVQYLHDIPPHPDLEPFTIILPTTHEKILENWRKHLRALNEKRKELRPNKKIVAVLDSVVSVPGILLPWKEMVQICKEENIWSVVDAAHSIGQEVNIDLEKADPDFWVSNCHKWLFTKRSAALLYVPKRNQHLIKSTFPTSAAYIPAEQQTGKQAFVEQFLWNGTIDWTNYFTVVPALDFREWIGGEEKINAYCRKLAIEGGKKLAETMGTEVLDDTENQELTLNMANVTLPISSKLPFTAEVDLKFKTKMLRDKNTFGAHYLHNGRWCVRVSAQIWVEVGDFVKLGKAYLDVCPEIEREVLGEEKGKL
ncbi:hypothetical protein PQX77_003084 [Marasmius sp. AFHP31]|nr:hypothetical protein PQX77_003084 [Marasmius sp. AFHP31]